MRIPARPGSANRSVLVGVGIAVVALLLGTTGGAVAGGLITGAKIKDGTVTTADIKNNNLTAADLKDEARIFGNARGFTDGEAIDDFTADAFTSIVSQSFTVPRGYAAITVHVDVEADSSLGSDGDLQFGIQLDGTTYPSDHQLDTASGPTFQDGGSFTLVLPVTAGTHTARLVARDTASGSYVETRSISIIWTPTGSASKGPVARPVAGRASGNR